MAINLVRLKKSGSEKSFPLPSSVTVIGRRSHCDLRIPLMSVSKRHCQLSYDEGVLKIRDLDSRNGTILNGKRINEAVIQPGDTIKIGSLEFILHFDGQHGTGVRTDEAEQRSSQQSAPTNDTADELFADCTDLDEPGELEQDDS